MAWLTFAPQPCGAAQVSRWQAVRAYKLLLLDVVLPAARGLERVVVLDADQVVRGDVADLARSDLKVSSND